MRTMMMMKRGKSNKGTKREICRVRYESEFSAEIKGRRSDCFRLENLSPCYAKNGDDVLHYRILFLSKGGLPHGKEPIKIHITRIANEASLSLESEAEAVDQRFRAPWESLRIDIKFPTILHQKVKRAWAVGLDNVTKDKFIILPNYLVHVSEDESRVKAIYFTLENNQLDESKKNVPLWQLGIDEKTYWMEKNFEDQYIPLPFIHPNPEVDPKVPSDRIPQSHPLWKKKRERENPPPSTSLKGKVGGSTAYKLIGFFKNSGLEKPDPNVAMRMGRLIEMEVVVAYLKQYPNRKVYETGWNPHPKDKNQGASPDAIIVDTTWTIDSFPEWVINRCKRDNNINVEEIDTMRGILEIKVSKKNNAFMAYYLPQLYQEMICTDTWWAELVKYCTTSKEIKVYRVYRDPEFENKLRECITRSTTKLDSGGDYYRVVTNELNKKIMSECINVAMYYNSNDYSCALVKIVPEMKQYRQLRKTFTATTILKQNEKTRYSKKKMKSFLPKTVTKHGKRALSVRPGDINIIDDKSGDYNHFWLPIKTRTDHIGMYIETKGEAYGKQETLKVIKDQIDSYKELADIITDRYR